MTNNSINIGVLPGGGFIYTFPTQTTSLIGNSGGAVTDTAVPVFDGISGTIIKETPVKISNNGSLILPENSNPTASDPGEAKVFVRSIANRLMPAFVGPSGLDSILQPLLARNKVGYWNPPGNATTVPGVFGITAFTAMTGATVTGRNVATTSLATRMRRLGYPSAATAGSFAGARIAANQFTSGNGSGLGGFLLVERWVESDPAAVSGKRAFAGVSNITTTATNVEPNTLTNAVGVIQKSTDSTQWYWYAGGSSAAFVDTAIGTSIGAPGGNSTTAWELVIFCPPNVANTFHLQLTNLTTGVTATTTITGTATQVPQSSTLLSWRHWATNNATAAQVGIDFCSLYIETDY